MGLMKEPPYYFFLLKTYKTIIYILHCSRVNLFMSSREDWVPREDWAIVVEESRRVWRLAVLMRRDCGPKTFIP
jgi:hypothetical protein